MVKRAIRSKTDTDPKARLKATFAEFDSDGNGTISTRELGSALRCMGQNPTHSELQDMVNAVDSDGDGVPNSQDLCPFAPDPANVEGPDGLGTACVIMIEH